MLMFRRTRLLQAHIILFALLGILMALVACAGGTQPPTNPPSVQRAVEPGVSQTIAIKTGHTAMPHPLANVEQLDEHLGIWRGYVASIQNSYGMAAAVNLRLFPRVQAAFLTRGVEPNGAERFEPDLSFREFIIKTKGEPLPEFAVIVERLRFLGTLMDEPAVSLSEGQQYAINILGTNNQITFDLAVAGLLEMADPWSRETLSRMVQYFFDKFTFEFPGGSLLNHMGTNSFLPDFSD